MRHRVVSTDGQNDQIREFLRQLLNVGQSLSAGWAPRRPKIDEHILASERFEGNGRSVEGRECEQGGFSTLEPASQEMGRLLEWSEETRAAEVASCRLRHDKNNVLFQEARRSRER